MNDAFRFNRRTRCCTEAGSRPNTNERSRSGPAMRTAAVLAFGGIMHFIAPDFFDRIIPRLLPGKARMYTRASGAVALGTAGALVMPRTRQLGGTLAAFFFVAVTPAKVQLAFNWWRTDPPSALLKTVAIVQMPAQIPLVIEALKVRRDASWCDTQANSARRCVEEAQVLNSAVTLHSRVTARMTAESNRSGHPQANVSVLRRERSSARSLYEGR